MAGISQTSVQQKVASVSGAVTKAKSAEQQRQQTSPQQKKKQQQQGTEHKSQGKEQQQQGDVRRKQQVDKRQRQQEPQPKPPHDGSTRETAHSVMEKGFSAVTTAWANSITSPASLLTDSFRGTIPYEGWATLLLAFYFFLALIGYKVGAGWVRKALKRSGGDVVNRRVVLLGPSGSGKTSFLLRLRNQQLSPTVPSMQENIETVKIESPSSTTVNAATITMVDCPGHARLHALILPHLKEAEIFLFFIDSADKTSFKDAAEQLYDLLTNSTLAGKSLLLVANKSDSPDARSESAVLRDIEREIERSRVSRAALLEDEDDAVNFIGVEGELFKLLEHSPCKVEICSASVKNNEIADITDFLFRHLKDSCLSSRI